MLRRPRHLTAALLCGIAATACAGGSVVEEVSVPLASTTTIAAPETTRSARAERDIDAIVDRLRDEGSALPGLRSTEALCIAEGLTDRLGSDLADAFADIVIYEEPIADVRAEDVDEAAEIVLGCVDYRAVSARSLRDDLRFPASVASCVVSEFDDDDLLALLRFDLSPEDLLGEDDSYARLFAALRTCEGDDAAATLADAMADGLLAEGILGEDETACFRRSAIGRFDPTVTDPTALMGGAMLDCVDVKRFMAAALVADGALDEEQAQCFVDEIDEAVLREMLLAEVDDDPDTSAEDTARGPLFAAMQRCI